MFSTDFAKFFAEAVRRHRKNKNLSQEQLAEKADLSSKMISLIERGERTPSVSVAERIAQGLSVPFWRLVKDAEDAKRKERHNKK
jgi:transcriptional regulator with XRE-family HTH domain